MGTRIAISQSGMVMLDADGFEQNTTIEGKQQDICGDVTGNGVTWDALLLSNYIGYFGYSMDCTKGEDIEKLRKTAI